MLKHKIFFLIVLNLTVLLCLPSAAAQSKTPNAENWADWAFADYDITPDITYSIANNTELKLDLYLPRNRENAVPVLLLFHGGGWVGGQKERNVFQLLPYLSMGWAVLNVEYRLANNSPAPAAVEDCRCALRWAFYRAKQYNFDTSKIVLTGGSAGGHLALMTGMLPDKNEFDRACPTEDETRWTQASAPSIKVAAIVNFYGITDVADLLEGENARHYAIEWFGSAKNRMALAREVSPVNYVRAGAPPIITFHGDRDEIVPFSQAVRFHAALDKAGAVNRLVTLKGAGHGGFNRQQLVESFAAVREFLRQNGVLPAEIKK